MVYITLIWKIVKEFPNYEVSNLGEIRNKATKKHLKQQIKEKGYKGVILHKNNKKYNLRVHRIVATEFIENPLNKPYVNHLNGNKADNRSKNLEWVTPSENNIHAINIGLTDMTRFNIPVILIDVLTLEKQYFNSLKECEERINIKNLSTKIIKKHIIKSKYISFYENEFTDNYMLKALKKSKAIQLFDENNNLIKEFYNDTEASHFLNIKPKYVSYIICNNKTLHNKYKLRRKWN